MSRYDHRYSLGFFGRRYLKSVVTKLLFNVRTEEDDVDITDTNVDDASDIQSYLKDYLEDKEKREAETSSNLKRAPNRDLVYSTCTLNLFFF